jgi:hypothetical protein
VDVEAVATNEAAWVAVLDGIARRSAVRAEAGSWMPLTTSAATDNATPRLHPIRKPHAEDLVSEA